MKKKYESPEMGIVEVEALHLLAGSFLPGETGGIGTGGDETLDPSEGM